MTVISNNLHAFKEVRHFQEIDPFYLAEFNRVRRTYQDIAASSIALDGPSNDSPGEFEEMEETDGESVTEIAVSSFIAAAADVTSPASPTTES